MVLTNEPTFYLETSTNQSYPIALEIIFYSIYIGFLIAFVVKSPIIPYTHGTLQYLYASSRNLIQNGSLWIGSDQYIWITPAHSLFSPWLIIVGIIQIIYAASTRVNAISKQRIVYSSVSHIYGFHHYRNLFYI